MYFLFELLLNRLCTLFQLYRERSEIDFTEKRKPYQTDRQ